VVIPAYNEEARLESTLRDTIRYFRGRRHNVEVIVVDDGSLDHTSALVNRLSAEFDEIRLMRLPMNRGKGYAVRTGIANARGAQILFMDADGATPIGEIERLEAAVLGGSDGAIGSRAVPAQEVHVTARWYRRFIGRMFHSLVNALAVRGYHDTQCGFKLFNAPVAQDLFSRMRMNGFSFDVEVLLMARYRRYRIAEVPVNWSHQAGSRVNLLLDPLRMLRDLLIIHAHMLRGDYATPHVTPLVHKIAAPS
jgi:dolichyl-phosphate beta-glucosyltransferase